MTTPYAVPGSASGWAGYVEQLHLDSCRETRLRAAKNHARRMSWKTGNKHIAVYRPHAISEYQVITASRLLPDEVGLEW